MPVALIDHGPPAPPAPGATGGQWQAWAALPRDPAEIARRVESAPAALRERVRRHARLVRRLRGD